MALFNIYYVLRQLDSTHKYCVLRFNLHFLCRCRRLVVIVFYASLSFASSLSRSLAPVHSLVVGGFFRLLFQLHHDFISFHFSSFFSCSYKHYCRRNLSLWHFPFSSFIINSRIVMRFFFCSAPTSSSSGLSFSCGNCEKSTHHELSTFSIFIPWFQ